MGLFLLVRMGLVHMWAFYLKSYGLNEIRKIIFGPMYIYVGRQDAILAFNIILFHYLIK